MQFILTENRTSAPVTDISVHMLQMSRVEIVEKALPASHSMYYREVTFKVL
jgi:hypothetical protein